MLSVAKPLGGGPGASIAQSAHRTIAQILRYAQDDEIVMLSVAKHLGGGMVRRSNHLRTVPPPRCFATLSMTNRYFFTAAQDDMCS